MIYLMSPYSHKSKKIELERYTATVLAASVLSKTLFIFSPIIHSHPLHKCVERPWEEWLLYDLQFIRKADEAMILNIDGWHLSRGIALECIWFSMAKKKISLVTVDGDRYYTHTYQGIPADLGPVITENYKEWKTKRLI